MTPTESGRTPALRRLAPDEFRDVIGHFASGVTVVTALQEGRPFGTTASAVSSLSLEPPMLLICMNKDSETGRAIAAARRFALNILGEDQADTAVRFAAKGGDKFGGVPVSAGQWGEPLLAEALATLECRVVEETTGGTHFVFIAEVDRGCARTGTPLAYWRGQFGRLELAQSLTGEAGADTVRARAAIEIGVVTLTVGRLAAAELAGYRGTEERAGAFLEHLVALAGSPVLVDAYRRLGVEGPAVDGHHELLDAYERGDLDAALRAIDARTEQALEALDRASGG